MSPTCGGTCAVRLTAQGRLSEAWAYNPMGIVAVLGAAAVTARAAIGLTTGRWANVGLTWTPRRKRLVLAVAPGPAVALEVASAAARGPTHGGNLTPRTRQACLAPTG